MSDRSTPQARKSGVVEVWVGIQYFTPNHPPNPPRVERVFGNEKAARRWADEFNYRPRLLYGEERVIKRMEVEDDA